MEFHSYVFHKDVVITENDVVVKIWAPILERLFRRTDLRTKWYVKYIYLTLSLSAITSYLGVKVLATRPI